jgi:NADH-quinone oxidoreductase subunit C
MDESNGNAAQDAEAVTAEAQDPIWERIDQALEGLEYERAESGDAMPAIEVRLDRTHEILRLLRDRAGFEMLTLITAVDHYPEEPRFVVVHQLLSLEHNDRLRVRTPLPGEAPRLTSCIDIWPGGAYMERECYDMFGVEFGRHAGLKRLLMPEGYDHHPLRKDFPVRGIEPDRLYREWDAKRRETWSPEQ